MGRRIYTRCLLRINTGSYAIDVFRRKYGENSYSKNMFQLGFATRGPYLQSVERKGDILRLYN